MKPILFNQEMTLAVMENCKTQTRRVIRFPSGRLGGPEPASDQIHLDHFLGEHAFFKIEPFYQVRIKCPYKAGDILYVRETWSTRISSECYAQPCHSGICPHESCELADEPCFPDEYIYKATDSLPTYGGKWHPSIHMPKEAARIFLRVTDVRVERLCDITEQDAKAEGAEPAMGGDLYKFHFSNIWDSTIKPADLERCGWAANPWVWVYGFERCERP